LEPANPQNSQPVSPPLPPEVEAELRRRAGAHMTPAGPPAPVGESWPGDQRASSQNPPGAPPLGDFVLPGAGAAGANGGAHAGHKKAGLGEWLMRLGPIGALLLAFGGKLKFLLPVLKFGLPMLKTGGTMLLSMAFYAQNWGWGFAAGFVLSILVHEMGHVFAAWRLGIPVSAPVFIPFMGAFILQKRAAKSAWDEALIGIGGPIGGTLAALFCLLLYQVTGHELMLGLAFTGAFLNLFNLAPIFPLDGGWITGAINPRIWLVGVIGMAALFFSGFIRNPFIILIVLLSLPRLWRGLKHGDVTPEGGVPVTAQQRMVMGVAYVGLAAFLVWLMAHTYVPKVSF
jgi:Zn-dependent protease